MPEPGAPENGKVPEHDISRVQAAIIKVLTEDQKDISGLHGLGAIEGRVNSFTLNDSARDSVLAWLAEKYPDIAAVLRRGEEFDSAVVPRIKQLMVRYSLPEDAVAVIKHLKQDHSVEEPIALGEASGANPDPKVEPKITLHVNYEDETEMKLWERAWPWVTRHEITHLKERVDREDAIAELYREGINLAWAQAEQVPDADSIDSWLASAEILLRRQAFREYDTDKLKGRYAELLKKIATAKYFQQTFPEIKSTELQQIITQLEAAAKPYARDAGDFLTQRDTLLEAYQGAMGEGYGHISHINLNQVL